MSAVLRPPARMDIFGRMPHKAVIIFVAEAAESLGFRVQGVGFWW